MFVFFLFVFKIVLCFVQIVDCCGLSTEKYGFAHISHHYFSHCVSSNTTKLSFIQDKRVPILIKYSNDPALRPYFLTAAKKIKDENPDVIIEKRLVPLIEDNKDEDLIFEVLVDDKVVVGKPQCKWQGVNRSSSSSRSNNSNYGGNNSSESMNGNGEKENENIKASSSRVFGLSVYISMSDVNDAIAKARRKRRPSTAYAQTGGVGLEILSES